MHAILFYIMNTKRDVEPHTIPLLHPPTKYYNININSPKPTYFTSILFYCSLKIFLLVLSILFNRFVHIFVFTFIAFVLKVFKAFPNWWPTRKTKAYEHKNMPGKR